MINSFTGKYHFLSNFFIEPDGSCVEKEFQALKADDPEEMAAVLLASTPGIAKKLGRRVKMVEDWDVIRFHLMQFLVLKKFLDHPELREKLLATGDEELIEGNHWGDTFWGVCKGEGLNCLGIILMEVRRVLAKS